MPNDNSVWAQAPVYQLLSVAEVLLLTTLSEFRYSEAPESMRSLVQAPAQLSCGIGSSLGITFSPLSKDPQILYHYTGLAATMITAALLFWFAFRQHDISVLFRPDSSAKQEPLTNPTDTEEASQAWCLRK